MEPAIGDDGKSTGLFRLSSLAAPSEADEFISECSNLLTAKLCTVAERSAELSLRRSCTAELCTTPKLESRQSYTPAPPPYFSVPPIVELAKGSSISLHVPPTREWPPLQFMFVVSKSWAQSACCQRRRGAARCEPMSPNVNPRQAAVSIMSHNERSEERSFNASNVSSSERGTSVRSSVNRSIL